jgi:hypothetical protein
VGREKVGMEMIETGKCARESGQEKVGRETVKNRENVYEKVGREKMGREKLKMGEESL